MTDIVERLRRWQLFGYGADQTADIKEAADTLERLEAALKIAQKDLEFLDALREAGVDNWSGYDYAIDILENKNGQ